MTRNGSRRRWPLVVLLVVVALLAGGYLWWTSAARRVGRELAAVRVPGTRLTDEQIVDNGPICITDCTRGTRYYVVTGPPRATAYALVDALRQRGFRVEINRCTRCDDRLGREPYALRAREWLVYADKKGVQAHGAVGPRVDGQWGMRLEIR